MAVAFWTTINGLAMHRAAKAPDPGLFLHVFFAEDAV